MQHGNGPVVFRAAHTRSRQRAIHCDRDCRHLTQVSDDNILEKPLPSVDFPWIPKCPDCWSPWPVRIVAYYIQSSQAAV